MHSAAQALENATQASLLSHLALENATQALRLSHLALKNAAQAMPLSHLPLENAAPVLLLSHLALENVRTCYSSGKCQRLRSSLRSKMLLEEAVLYDTELCYTSPCSALLCAWICTGSH